MFDSGVGGLAVLKALREALPHEDFIYLGDTARLPYGTKGAETVTQYALQAARLLMHYDIKLLVVACNTATALALPDLEKHLPRLPCLGVIGPSAKKAAENSATGRIAVISTEGTARSGAYAAAIKHYRPDSEVQMLGCGLLVALAEEGWCNGAEAEAIIQRYLAQLRPSFDTLVLGCTHFSLLTPAIRKLVPPNVSIIDTATTTADAIWRYVKSNGLMNTQRQSGTNRFFATDLPERFGATAARFLASDTTPEVTLVQLLSGDMMMEAAE